MLGTMIAGREVVLTPQRPWNARLRRSHTPTGVYQRKPKPLMDRFMRFVSPEPNTGCWLWIGASNSTGYGFIAYRGNAYGAHRMSHELYKGPIPDGFEIDHLCRVKSCVNPDHLEAVLPRVNLLRSTVQEVNRRLQLAKTHCPHGHPYSGDNLVIAKVKHTRSGTQRICRTCRNACQRKYSRAKKCLS